MRLFFARILFCAFMVFPAKGFTQCTWTTYFYDSFEYTTVIPYIVPGTTYQNSPQTFAGCIHSGSSGLYLNVADGVSGLIYDQPFTSLCIGQNYRFSFWTRDAWSGSNNLTVQVLDASNTVLSTQNVLSNSTWLNVVMPAFIATTSDIHFRISTNIPGGAGNDIGIDDLMLSACNPTPTNVNITQCAGSGSVDLYSSISAANLSSSGIWTGPSALQNGYLGTFTQGTNTNGTYTYTIDGIGNCPDSVANVAVQYIATPNINPLGPISVCGSYTLPTITGTSLSGSQHYYSGPNGTGTMFANASVLTSSQTIYIYDGIPGCSDNETVSITVSSPVNAGNNNGGSYCGPGPLIDMDFFLSAGTTTGGTWSETTSPASGTFNTANAEWNTTPLSPGTYTFQYTLAPNGACAGDQSNFTLIIGNIPDVDLGNDTTLCTGQSLWLNAGTYDNYLWNNGSSNPTKYVSSPGTYWVRVGTLGANQIINGDFEQGNSGFTTQYVPGTGGPWGQLSNPGTFAITSSPNLVHSNFSNCQDHTTGAGVNQLVVNGASTANTEVWCQTIPTQPNTTYQFGAWVASVEINQPVSQLQFYINNSPLGSVFSPGTQPCNWTQFTQNWTSGLTTNAEICIVNQNTSSGGNDFAIDDITFRPVCYSYDTIVIQYSTPPVVNLGADQFVCNGTTVTLDALNPGLNFLWNTAEITQTIDVTQSGNYSVTVSNPTGCSATDQVIVTYEAPLNAGNDSSAVLCTTQNQFDLNDLIQTGSSTGGTWESITASFNGSLGTDGIADLNDQAGIFSFNYIVHGTYCPNDTATYTLTIHRQPVAAPDVNLHLCNTVGDQTNFTPYLVHPFAPVQGYWVAPANLPGGAFNSNSSVLNLSGLPHDIYDFAFVLPAEEGCIQDTMTIGLKVTAVPIVQFSSDITEGCQPLNVQFINESTAPGTVVYEWDLGEGTTSGSPSTVDNTYESALCYDVTLTATSDGLCTSTQTQNNMICVHPVPDASFYYGPQQVFSDGPSVDFTNTSVDHDACSWQFGDGSGSTSENPQHTYPIGDIGNYTVELIVTTNFGCSDTAQQIIIVKDQLLFYVPNSFTPDGDEFNAVFIPVMTAGMDEQDYHIEIYNRWGEIVFQTDDIHEGWDGTYKGHPAKEGTYTWKLEFGLIDTDEVKLVTGNVNLIR